MAVNEKQVTQDAFSLNRIILQIGIIFRYEGENSVGFKEEHNDLIQPEER
jgi:hypothetical protein